MREQEGQRHKSEANGTVLTHANGECRNTRVKPGAPEDLVQAR
jgi:hypothetical protein